MTTFVVCEDSGEYDMYSRTLIGVAFHELDAHKLATHREILIFRFEGEGRSVPTEILTVAQARDRVRYCQAMVKAGHRTEQDLTKARFSRSSARKRPKAMSRTGARSANSLCAGTMP